MYLSHGDIIISEKIRSYIFITYDKDKQEQIKCHRCNGTGLDNISNCCNNDNYSWDCNSYCSACNGIGYVNPGLVDRTMFICKKCKGSGLEINKDKYCKQCLGLGYTDFITNVFGRRK